MPTYTFRLPARFASTPVTVYNTADVQQTTGTTDANALFTASLPTGDYYAKIAYGYTSYRAAGEVDRGDLDNVSESALSATFAGVNTPALLSAGRKWVFTGDSITNGSSAASGRRFVEYVPHLVGSVKIAPPAPISSTAGVWSTVAGVPGERSDQIVARLDALLTAGVGGVCLLMGTNDASQAVTTSAFMAQAALAAAKCRKAGVPLVLGTVPPRSAGTATSIRQSIAGYNLALRQWAPLAGVYLADVYGALVDVSSGALLAAYDSGDGTHPNTPGHRLIAEAFATACRRAILTQPPLVSAKSVSSLVGNPMFNANTSGWFEQPGGTGTAPTYSRVADSTGRLPVGAQWYEMAFDATASGGSRTLATALSAKSTGVTWDVGDVLLLSAMVDVVDVAGFATAANADPATASYKVQLVNSGGVALAGQSVVPQYGGAMGDIAVAVQVPAGVTGINLWIPCTLPTGANAKFRFSAVDVRNLTLLGAAGLF